MKKKYDLYEIDLYDLKSKILYTKKEEFIVFGTGNNSSLVSRLLKNMGKYVKYYVDINSSEERNVYRKRPVYTPEKFSKIYAGEYVIVTPNIHKSIISWMESNSIPADRILESFYRTETISIDYGEERQKKISDDIAFCDKVPEKYRATFVTIAYNTPENILRRAIESVLRQTSEDFKYLIINNGADENTSDVIREYGTLDKRITVIELMENIPWTDTRLLSAIRDNIEGDYCCQLDSDDYYASDFFEKAIFVGKEKDADIVCVKTCLFAADVRYDPMKTGFTYDTYDKFFLNVHDPRCDIFGHRKIMTAYAKSEICSTFWGKLYSTDLMTRYLDYLISLPSEKRELYYRLDIAMTYRILSMAKRVTYIDEVLHFSQYSTGNSTFTLAPVEWLMSLWYAYQGIWNEMHDYYKKEKADKYSRDFLKVHLSWMVNRKGMLAGYRDWKYKDEIVSRFSEMLSDKNFKKVMNHMKKRNSRGASTFYSDIENIVKEASMIRL